MRGARRAVLAAAVLVGSLWAAAGCQQPQRLVDVPAAPYFGPRTAASAPFASSSSFAPRAAQTLPGRSGLQGELPHQGAWGEAAWAPAGPERRWQFIVVHHSATPSGSAAEFNRMHIAKGWDELGYHFVIGNGTGSRDGEVEVGSRWETQKHGAHCKVLGHPEYNDVGIGICLVGNFGVTHPSESQMASLARLVRFLMNRYDIPRTRIYGHGQLKPTDCPGRNFSYGDLFRRL